MTSRRTWIPLMGSIAAAALLVGCGTTTSLDDKNAPPVETRTPVPTAGATVGLPGAVKPGAATPTAAPQSRVATVDLAAQNAANAAASALSQRIVYFDFDSFVIKDEFTPTLDVHAKALAASRAKKLTIEGHTDERGGREYNLALGQKRAEAVAKSLALLGAGEQQVEAVSFGKERPADNGHDEAAWAKNRRAELKDR
jgi:peptidoglycan-associated lipoprotein